MTYLFYDIETTGLNRAFDQVLRFAAIRTDERLREVDRHLIKVRLRDDIVPAPSAVITHRISIESARTEGQPEVEAVREIHELMNTPETISLGYNSLGFDDEFLRFSFYRNLLPPYTHQWKNDCGRMDLYPMTVIYRLRESALVDWPTTDGGSTLRLEDLSAANHLTDGRAHTAMADTEATVELARRMAENRALWNELHDHFDKQLDRGRYDRLPRISIGPRSYRVGVLINGVFGGEQNYQRPVLSLGRHRTYSNQVRLLALDSSELRDAPEESVTDAAEICYKKFGIPDFLFPSNASDVIHLGRDRRTLANTVIKRLKANPALLESLADRYLEETYPERTDVDVDAGLYQSSFWNDTTEQRCAAFHAATELEHKLAAVNRFERNDLQKLARRVLIRNFDGRENPRVLTNFRETYWDQMFPGAPDRVPIDHRDRNRRTPEEALQEIGQLRSGNRELDAEQLSLLDEMEAYITGRFAV